MCVAIPFGHQNKKHRSRFWSFISSSPLRLLGTAALFQAIVLGLFWLATKLLLLDPARLSLNVANITLYISLFGVFIMLISGLLMSHYPQWMGQSEIEYLHYAGLFFGANFSLLLFYAGVFFSHKLIISSLLLYLAVLIFAFKPLYWIGSWADRRHKPLALLVNCSLAIKLLMLTGFVVFLVQLALGRALP